MNVVGKITVNMKPINQILDEKGLTARGDVQQFHTQNVLRRIEKYTPCRTGATIKLMLVQTDINKPEIVVNAPYARYLYYGKVMVDAKTGKGPMNIPGVGLRFRNGAVLKATDRDLQYTKTKNPLAGPFWDRTLVAAEGAVMQRELQNYVDRKAGKR